MDRNLAVDLRSIIRKTFHEFVKKEPTQFTDANWNDPFTCYRFDRASILAAENLLKEYDIIKKQ